MKIKLFDSETAAKVSRAIYPERAGQGLGEALEYISHDLFGCTLEGVTFREPFYCYRDTNGFLWNIPSYFCSRVWEGDEKGMRQRYLIHREYFGKFEDDVVIAVTESLTEAAFIVENLNKAFKDRPYIFDFRKVAEDVDPALDYVPGESFAAPGEVLNCFCIADYHEKKGATKW